MTQTSEISIKSGNNLGLLFLASSTIPRSQLLMADRVTVINYGHQ